MTMAKDLRLWYVQYHEDEYWVLVAARSRGEAKALFHRLCTNESDMDGEWTDIRAHLCTKVTIPESITEPQVFERCEPWMCDAFFGFGDACVGCVNEAKKRQESEEQP